MNCFVVVFNNDKRVRRPSFYTDFMALNAFKHPFLVGTVTFMEHLQECLGEHSKMSLS